MIIREIFEKDGVTPKESHQYRVGRKGLLYGLKRNKPMIFEYEDGHGILRTSLIEDFQQTDCGVCVFTRNTIYKLDREEDDSGI